MTLSIEEVGKVLARAQAVDNRTVGATTITMWADILGPVSWLTYDDACAAVVEHFRSSTEYLKPAHIVSGARSILMLREERQRQVEGFVDVLRAVAEGRGSEPVSYADSHRSESRQEQADRLQRGHPELFAEAERAFADGRSFTFTPPRELASGHRSKLADEWRYR